VRAISRYDELVESICKLLQPSSADHAALTEEIRRRLKALDEISAIPMPNSEAINKAAKEFCKRFRKSGLAALLKETPLPAIFTNPGDKADKQGRASGNDRGIAGGAFEVIDQTLEWLEKIGPGPPAQFRMSKWLMGQFAVSLINELAEPATN